MDSINMKSRIRKLRLDKDMQQSDLAKVFNVSSSTISTYENGREPPLEMLVKYAEYFDVSSDYLLGLSKQRNLDTSNKFTQLAANIDKAMANDPGIADHAIAALRGIAGVYRTDPEQARILQSTLIDAFELIAASAAAIRASDTAALLDATNAGQIALTTDTSAILHTFLRKKDKGAL